MHYIIKASAYYSRKSPGWIAILHGYPWHHTGPTGKRDAQAVVDQANKTVDRFTKMVL